MLTYNREDGINLVVMGNCPSAAKVKEYIYDFAVSDYSGPFREFKNGERHYDGLTICLADSPSHLEDLDSRVEIGIFGLEKTLDSSIGMDLLPKLNNSVLIGRPLNLPLYAARIIGLIDKGTKEKLVRFREQEAEKYPQRKQPIDILDFKR